MKETTLGAFAFSHEALEEDWLVKRVQAELAAGTKGFVAFA